MNDKTRERIAARISERLAAARMESDGGAWVPADLLSDALAALREGADAAPQCYCDRLREEAIAAGRDEFHACYVCAPEAGTMLAILPTAPADAASPPDRLWAWTTPEGRVTAVLAAKAEPPFVEYTRAAPREDALAVLRERVRVLSAFARTAPGRLPQRVQDALSDWESPERALTEAPEAAKGGHHGDR